MTNRAVPTFSNDFQSWLRNAAPAINDLMHGHSNNSGTVTLTASVASTTLTDDRVSFKSAVVLIPTTANAAAEIGNGTMYISETGRVNGSVVITHANNVQTDRTFRFLIQG
jgi:hypothetical protein